MQRETVHVECVGPGRGKVRVFTQCGKVPHLVGQKLDGEVNMSKCLLHNGQDFGQFLEAQGHNDVNYSSFNTVQTKDGRL